MCDMVISRTPINVVSDSDEEDDVQILKTTFDSSKVAGEPTSTR